MRLRNFLIESHTSLLAAILLTECIQFSLYSIRKPLFVLYCHTRAPSWILSQAENLASVSLQDGATKWYYFLVWTTHPPPTHPQLSFSCKCCVVSPPQQSMCGVPPSQYMLSFNVVRCPHPICSTHQECMCGVPPCNSVPLPHLALSWILSKVENLESSSL